MPHRAFEKILGLARCTCRISVALIESVLTLRTERHGDFTGNFRYGVGESMHSTMTRRRRDTMTLAAELAARRSDRFLGLILDNEVTVGEFVMQPPLHWTRCIQRNGVFQVAEGYPTLLTEAQATLEMRNWDDVSLGAIIAALPALGDSVDYIIFGNNAGQGLPLAQSLSSNLMADRAAVIYARKPAADEQVPTDWLSQFFS